MWGSNPGLADERSICYSRIRPPFLQTLKEDVLPLKERFAEIVYFVLVYVEYRQLGGRRWPSHEDLQQYQSNRIPVYVEDDKTMPPQ